MGTESVWVPMAIYGIATAVGTGISMYGQYQQAENSERIAGYNAQVQQQNADVRMRMAQQQALWNQQAATAQYQAQQNNAATLDLQARQVEAQGREQARRMREEQERLLARQRAAYAASGVVNEGTPLAVLSETARTSELNIQDTVYQSELESRNWQRKAEHERFQSGFSLMEAETQRYEGLMASVGRRIAYREADITRLSGRASAQGYRTQAGATLMSGVASMASQVSDLAYKLKKD